MRKERKETVHLRGAGERKGRGEILTTSLLHPRVGRKAVGENIKLTAFLMSSV